MGPDHQGCSNKSWTGAVAKTLRYATGESGSYQKEIGELLPSERRSLAPALREHVAEQFERYLAEQGSVDLLERRQAYTKHIRDLTPTDLPALIEAERHRVEEHQRERQRAEFVEVGAEGFGAASAGSR